MVRPRSLLPALVALATLAAPCAAVPAASAMHPDSPVAGSSSYSAPAPAPSAQPSRSSRARTAAAPATGTLATSGGTATATASSSAPEVPGTTGAVEDTAPLAVSVGSLAPSVVPQRGALRVTGTVTNLDDVPWSTINLYPFVSTTPMTTRAELAEAATADPSAFVGDRITDPGPFATIKELAPGESATYTVRVPRPLLPVSEPGVYWFGVHALGESSTSSRDGLADGRARTFLPLVRKARSTPPVETAIVVPLRRGVAREPDGSITGPEAWADTLGPGGRLRSLLDFGAAAGARPVTWLVDPAVGDAARRLAAGNPARTTGPTLDPDEGDDPDLQPDPDTTPGASLSPSPSDSADGDGDGSGSGEDGEQAEPDPDPAAEAASTWLDRLAGALSDGEVLALPYGDLDVSAAATHDRTVYRQARARSADALRQLAPDATPVITSPGGYLDPGAVRLATQATTVMVSDAMVEGDAPGVVSVDDHPVAVFSSATGTGGPGPDDRLAIVAVRQRLLAEAAVRHLQAASATPDQEVVPGSTAGPGTTGGAGAATREAMTPTGPEPLVVVLPDRWVPAGTTGFFQGLDVPWLQLSTVDDITDGAALDRDDEPVELDYPTSVQRRELTAADFGAARALERAGDTLQNLLRRNDRVAGEVTDEALSNLSYASRVHPTASRRRAEASRAWIETRLRSIDIEAPPSVTLSSASGRFSVTVSNNLDEPVTVAIDAIVDGPVVIDGPDTVELAARSRRTVLLTASTERQGVHNVTLVVTDLDGTALGSSDQLPIRAAQFSVVIWVIIGGGLALFLGAVAVRVVRTVRARRRALETTSAPGDADVSPSAPDSQETPA
ncbi:DUF6049 family protein [Nocardioides sp. zg-DK7169]|uniref:DUF6049 family protein n=1 Tax=Nocardioides sp. zg-DK7169 TaxID=2736600 RepID=UPI001551723E|nr:DUF6049 family protein [Nocardioides sp. zg-DK7169]NPC98760.1 hypothetical protein [Nocardioides sp. zg-DK7169]